MYPKPPSTARDPVATAALRSQAIDRERRRCAVPGCDRPGTNMDHFWGRYSPQFVRLVTEKLMIYGLGRGTEYYDMPLIRAIVHDAEKTLNRPSRSRWLDLFRAHAATHGYHHEVAAVDATIRKGRP